jgi:hypothetical protein
MAVFKLKKKREKNTAMKNVRLLLARKWATRRTPPSTCRPLIGPLPTLGRGKKAHPKKNKPKSPPKNNKKIQKKTRQFRDKRFFKKMGQKKKAAKKRKFADILK